MYSQGISNLINFFFCYIIIIIIIIIVDIL